MSGLETAAAVIGIADVGFKGVSALYDFIGKMQKAPQEVAKLKSEVGALDGSLRTLGELQISKIGQEKKDCLKRICLAETVNKCGQSSQDLAKKLEKWNAGGENTLLSKLQTAFHEKDIQRYTASIQCAKGSVQLAVSTATLWILVQEQASDPEKDRQIREQETEIVRLQKEAKTGREEIDKELTQFRAQVDDPEEPGLLEREIIRNMEACRTAAEKYWASCAVAAKEIRQSTGMIQSIKDVISGDDAVVWVGMPASVVKEFEQQSIGEVRSGRGAKVSVGTMNV